MTRTRRKAARTQKYFEESSSNVYDSEVEKSPQKRYSKKQSHAKERHSQAMNKEAADSSFDE